MSFAFRLLRLSLAKDSFPCPARDKDFALLKTLISFSNCWREAVLGFIEKRTAEAKELGPQGQISDDWLEVQYNGKTIKVFPIQPNEKAFYFGKTSEGGGVGFTPLNTDSPLQ